MRSASPIEAPPEVTRTSHRERAAVREEARAACPARSLKGGREGGREGWREEVWEYPVSSVGHASLFLTPLPPSLPPSLLPDNLHIHPILPPHPPTLPPSLLPSLPPSLPYLTIPRSTTFSLPTNPENNASNVGLLLSRISPPSLPPSIPASMSSSPVERMPMVGLGNTERDWARPTEARRPGGREGGRERGREGGVSFLLTRHRWWAWGTQRGTGHAHGGEEAWREGGKEGGREGGRQGRRGEFPVDKTPMVGLGEDGARPTEARRPGGREGGRGGGVGEWEGRREGAREGCTYRFQRGRGG